MPHQQAPVIGKATRQAWLIWSTAVVVYLLAVFHRTSFGVAGLTAAERFHIGAAALGVFTVMQIGVYAAMQIPTGILVDRYGPRVILTVALIFLGAGEILTAVATSYALGLLARAVLGLGDALTFVSVLRLAAAHFPGRQFAAVTTFTSAVGFIGNFVATVPLTLLLGGFGWTPTLMVAGLLTLAYTTAVALRVKNTPESAPPPAKPARTDIRAVARQIADAWRVPGTRLGFWVHFSTMFAPNVLTLLWGVPFLVQAQGIPVATASAVLTVFVFGSLLGGPALGSVITARPAWRIPLVVGYLLGAALVWTMLLTWPGTIPLAVLVPAFAFLALGGPASMIGFALARDYNPLRRVGTATGVVNVGGFVASTITAFAIGVLLELSGGSFRIALLAVVVMLAFGGFRTFVWWRRARAAVFVAQSRGEAVPVQIRRRPWDIPVPALSAA